MPLTSKGKKIRAAMHAEYGDKKGESVFYASINKGKIKGAEKGGGKVSMQQIQDEAERARLPSNVRASYQRSGMSGGASVGGSGQGYGGKVMGHPIGHAKSNSGGRW